MIESKYDCMIVGGGISGISFAHDLHHIGKKVIVLEKENRAGGQICTRYAGDSDFWYEAGAHTCYNTYTSLLSMARDVGYADEAHPLNKYSYLAYTGGQLKKIFPEVSVPALLFNSPKVFFSSQKGKTVREYYTGLVGRKNYDKVFTNMFKAILSQNADDYPAELLMKKRKSRFKEFPRRYTFARGLSSLPDTIAEKDGFRVEKSCEVIKTDRITPGNETIYEIHTASGEKFRAPSLALAIDPQSGSGLLQKIEPSLAILLSSIPTFHSESLSIIVEKEKLPSVPRTAGIIPLSDDFLSAVSRDLVDHPSLRCFTFHFGKEAKTEDEKLGIACKALGIKPPDIKERATTNHILPSMRVNHLGMQGQVEAQRQDNNLYILGNFFGGVSIEDCVIRSFNEFERYKSVNSVK